MPRLWWYIVAAWLFGMALVAVTGCKVASTDQERRAWYASWQACMDKRDHAGICKYQTDRKHGKLHMPPWVVEDTE